MRGFIAAVVVVVAGVLFAAPTAGAQTPPGVESAVVEGESGSFACSAAQSAFSEAIAESVCIGSVQCKWTKSTSTYKSLLGFVLYKYWQKQSFCYSGNNGTITRLYDYSRGRSNVDQSWEFVRHDGLYRTGGVGTGGASVRTDGHFKQCISGIISCYHRYPWVITRMDNSGAVIFGGHN